MPTSTVLSNINLDIESRGFTCICGKSGCGKSTLLNTIYGIEKPSLGYIKIHNQLINPKNFNLIHITTMSMVFQHYNLFLELSALENVALPLKIRGVKKDIAEAKAIELFKKFSLENIISQKAATLSGGEKQRVAILRSLIISPKVILADEPTGALDQKNSVVVMDMFKEISKDISIVMVSHNQELVNKYADRIITLQDGKILSDTVINKVKSRHVITEKLTKVKDRWTGIFVKQKLKTNFKRNIISALSSAFGFLAILLSFGFTAGSEASNKNALNNNYSLGYARASTKAFYEITNSPLMYEKSTRPDIEDVDEKIKDFQSIKCEPNLDYAFSPYPIGRFNDEEVINFEMVPLYDSNLNENEVIINDEMVKLLKDKSPISKEMYISSETTFSYTTDDYANPFIKDTFSYHLAFTIKDVVKEFSFLNSPKVYYSYPSIQNFLKENTLINISRYLEKRISVYDYIDNANGDDIITSYCYNLFVTDNSEIDSFFLLISKLKESKDIFQIDSTAYEIKNSYTSFMKSFSDALFVFVIIAFVGVNFIIGMLSLSCFIESKKEAAILTCLGAKDTSIMKIFLNQNNILILLSYLISIALVFPFQLLINKIVSSSFGLDNLIQVPFLSYLNIPLLLPVGLLVVALLISTLFTIVPLLFYRKMSLTNELRDE